MEGIISELLRAIAPALSSVQTVFLLPQSWFFLGGALAGVITALLLQGFYKRKSAHVLANDQERFASLASHYLLTPISIIQAAIARLQEAEALAPGERAKLYGAVERGQQRLWITANQLLMVHRLSTNSLKISTQTVMVSDVIQRAITSVQPFARDKNVKIQFFDQLAADGQVRLDPRHTASALTAILDNAVKFSPEGGTVGVGLAGDALQGYTIGIRDAGPGISAETIARIGEKFVRGTKVYTFDYEGIGIGLYLAKQPTELQDGRFQVRPLPQGTQVDVWFGA